jgi:hypothetical protein
VPLLREFLVHFLDHFAPDIGGTLGVELVKGTESEADFLLSVDLRRRDRAVAFSLF